MSSSCDQLHVRPWIDNNTLVVINMFGGPGTGKSTTAAELFALMKKRGDKVELIHEIAKDYVWERWNHIFREQDWIAAHQHRLQRRLVGHNIDYVIVDSSLLLGMFYTPNDFPPSFKLFLREVYDSYTNVNIYLKRSDTIPYVREGRNQDLQQAQAIDSQVYQYLVTEKLPFYEVEVCNTTSNQILQLIVDNHPPRR